MKNYNAGVGGEQRLEKCLKGPRSLKDYICLVVRPSFGTGGQIGGAKGE